MRRDELVDQFLDGQQVLHRTWKTHFFKMLGDLTPGQVMVLFLLKRKQPLRGSDVAKEIGVTRSAITQLMESLYTLGYVTRTDDEQDRRVFYITLTSAGDAKFAELEAARRELFMKSAVELTDNELQAVITANAKMLAALEK
ncbi:MAG TPA: MarR family transcriptional regulator [Patescibacteria group bacterium]|nr:MarR family transcriptional regulator [Patescibacteria group bacterium]